MQIAWFLFGLPLLRSSLLPWSAPRRAILRAFGAAIGRGVVLKPGVRVKYPWFLSIGDHAWIGEDCWIDNFAQVHIGDHACLSQGVYLCTGNHDWSDRSFGYILRPIHIGDGAWVGARSVVCPGVTISRLAIVTAGSVAHKNIPEREIHGGNPAAFLRFRQCDDAVESCVR
jgi:putative colanic acid biosynthesis acetyltransferase WcaF